MHSTPPRALLITPYEGDRQFLRNLLAREGWTVHTADSILSALSTLGEPPSLVITEADLPALVITEADLPAGTWKNVLEIMDFLPNPPPIIVVSTNTNKDFWAEAVRIGAHDVLTKPFETAEVVRVLTAAWMHTQGSAQKPKSFLT